MDITPTPSIAFAALGNRVRLDLFRLLVRAGHPGMRVGEIADHLGLKASTLAHHLGALVQAGLVVQAKSGREVYNRVDYAVMNALIEFLTDECCRGVARSDEDKLPEPVQAATGVR